MKAKGQNYSACYPAFLRMELGVWPISEPKCTAKLHDTCSSVSHSVAERYDNDV